MLKIERGSPLWTKPTENFQKQIKKETKIERSDPLYTDSLYTDSGHASFEIPEWLQEFTENLVDDEVPQHRDSHASSSHEVSLEPSSKRSEDLSRRVARETN